MIVELLIVRSSFTGEAIVLSVLHCAFLEVYVVCHSVRRAQIAASPG